MPVKTPDKLFYIKAKQTEMYDPGNLADITHYLLYNQTKGILIDITADVKQAPLLSEVEPMEFLGNKDVKLIEKLMKEGIKEPDPKLPLRPVTYVKEFECKELEGRMYGRLAETMTELYETNQALDINVKKMRKLCKKLDFSYICKLPSKIT